MTDEKLRSLGRAAEVGGSAADTLRYARALERAGRRDDSLEVLVAARDPDASTRAELARFPAWAQADADAGRTHFLDLAPIRHEPRMKWISLERADPTGSRLLATPFGVAFAGPNGSTVVLDPKTGALRRRTGLVEPCAFAGDVLLVKRKTKLRGFDIESGAVLYEQTTGQLSFEALLADGVLVTASPSNVQAYRVPLTRQAPTFLWEYAVRRTNRKGRFGRAAIANGEVFVPQNGEVSVLDLGSGERKSKLSGDVVHADAVGLILSQERRIVSRAVDGRVNWMHEGEGIYPIALGPETVVAQLAEGPSVLERATGRVVNRLYPGWCDGVLCARDVVYVLKAGVDDESDDVLCAFSTKGEKLWEVTLRKTLEGPIAALAAGARRLFGLTRGGRVFCLEEGAPGR